MKKNVSKSGTKLKWFYGGRTTRQRTTTYKHEDKLENDLGRLFGDANLAATTDKIEYSEDLEDFKKELWRGGGR